MDKTDREKAPWKDYAGKDIHAGDWLVHPSGERGVVVVTSADDPGDKWLVRYTDSRVLSRLCLQVGDKGQAVVDITPPLSTTARL